MKYEKLALTLCGVALLAAAIAMLPAGVAAQDATVTPAPDPLAAEPLPDEGAAATSALARAVLMDVDGNTLGEVNVAALDDTLVFVQVGADGLPPGFHGFHVHTTGVCDPSGDPPFSSAGGHLNPDGSSHPNHAGDLPMLYATASGTVGMAFLTDRFTIEQLLDEDGSAIVVHSNPDNYANIPERYGGPDEETLNAGDSGTRIACGVFTVGGMASPDMMATEEVAG